MYSPRGTHAYWTELPQGTNPWYNYHMLDVPFDTGVVTLNGISTCFSLQVPTNGKQEALQHCHAHTTPPISHLRNNIHHPAIRLRIIALHISQSLVLRYTSCTARGCMRLRVVSAHSVSRGAKYSHNYDRPPCVSALLLYNGHHNIIIFTPLTVIVYYIPDI